MRTRRTRSITTVALASLALSTFVGCGSDEAEASTVPAAACDAAVDFGAAFAQAPQDPAELKAYAVDKVVPIGDTFVKHLEGDAGKAAKTLRDTFVEVGKTGDPSLLQAPAASAASTTVGKAIHDGCDLQTVEIEAVEYAFVGAPTNLKAGRVSFALENTGVEEHEMVLFKAGDDVTESLEELLALPEEEGMAKLEFTGVTFGGPDTTNYVAVDLEPGTYFLVCFIPQGGGEDGEPHFMAGMQSTITVA